MTKLLYTTVEAAELLGIGRSTLYLLLREGSIESVKIGGLRRISAQALGAYVDGLQGTYGSRAVKLSSTTSPGG